jgi:hypothetical protein
MPALDVALDGAAMVEILSYSLCTDDDLCVRSCAPYYVKYKPGKYCVVQYRLQMSSKMPSRHLAYAGLYPATRLRRLRARSGVAVQYSRELGGIVQLYPADLHLPGLSEASSPECMARRLRHLPEAAGSEQRVRSVDLVRYKAHKRAVLRYGLEGDPHRAVYGKIRKDGGPDLVSLYRVLRGSGAPAPEPLAHVSDLGMTVHAEETGTRLKDLRGGRDYHAWMEPVAGTLARLHDTTVSSLRTRHPAAQAEELTAAARLAERLLPGLAPDADHLAGEIGRALRDLDGDLTPVHGSFHDDQVLVGNNGVVMVDLDGAAIGNPLEDVGHFLSYLDSDGAHDAAELFLHAYGRARPMSDDVYLFEAASLLRWAALPFRELRPDWPDAVAGRVRQAIDCLSRFRPGIDPRPRGRVSRDDDWRAAGASPQGLAGQGVVGGRTHCG